LAVALAKMLLLVVPAGQAVVVVRIVLQAVQQHQGKVTPVVQVLAMPEMMKSTAVVVAVQVLRVQQAAAVSVAMV
jgi:hypothetical protein